jgi:lysophospholipase L1-like esterase
VNRRPAIALLVVLAVLGLATFGGGFRLVDDVISMHCLERAHEGRTVALGDSITLGKGDPAWNFQGDESWFSYATCDGPGSSASVATRYGWNAGKNGNTTQQMLARFARDVAARHPQQVVLLGGTNDIFQRVPIDVTTLRLADMIVRAKALAPVVRIGTIPPFNDPARRGDVDELNARIRQLAAAEHIGLVDFYAAVALHGSYRPGWTDDGIHPTPTAARAMGEAYRRATARG